MSALQRLPRAGGTLPEARIVPTSSASVRGTGAQSIAASSVQPVPAQLRIERLHLDGLALDRERIPGLQATIEAELASLLQTRPHAVRGGAYARLPAPALRLDTDASMSVLGVQIARALFAAFADRLVADAGVTELGEAR